MNPPDLPGLTNLERLLLFAVCAEAAAIVALFWQVVKANVREVEAYKVCSPLIQKLSELCEDFISRGRNGGTS